MSTSDTPYQNSDILLLLHTNVTDYPIAWSLQTGHTKLPPGVRYKHTSGANLNKMLDSGEADIGKMSVPAFAEAYEKSDHLRIISTYLKTYLSGLFTQKGSGVTPQDLRGKHVTVSNENFTTTTTFFGTLKERFGIKPDELRLERVPACPLIYQKIIKGETDAGILCPGGYIRGLNDERLDLVVNYHAIYKELYGDFPVTHLLVAKKKLLDDERTKQIVKVLRESLRIGNENMDGMVRDYQETCHCGELRKEFARVVLEGQRDNPNHKMFEPVNETHKESIVRIWNWAKEQGTIEKIPDIDELVVNL